MTLYKVNAASKSIYVLADSSDKAIDLFAEHTKDWYDRYKIVQSVDIIAIDIEYKAKENVSFLIIQP